jgi:sugar lactone lactonase YvrE
MGIGHSKSRNPLVGWQVDRAEIRTIGRDLQRPEGILAESDGTLWTADARGGVMRINPDGTQRLIAQTPDSHFDINVDAKSSLLFGTLPNGIAFDANGDILIANFGTDRLELMTRDGVTRTLIDAVDGQPLGKVNAVIRDSSSRIWITVSTRVNPWDRALRSTLTDGYVLLLDHGKLRIVAQGLAFANELKLDAAEEWLYVAESTAKRVSRLRVRQDGELTDREVFGPANLGSGLIDGIAFDSYGNLWGTMVLADRLIAITPEGELLELFDDGNPAGTARFEAEFATGEPASFETLSGTGGTLAPWLASITFGGPDLKTAYLGSLKGTTLPYFLSPVPGLPPVHWRGR